MLAGSRRRSPTVPDSSLTSDRGTDCHPDHFWNLAKHPITPTLCLLRSRDGRFGKSRSPSITSARAFAEPANGPVERR
ncbi:MAG: hypothetical protein HC769_27020 [Cyanobacteria bacterium CRU_2_1]|nr:hypothetical protein [Cyanobacteria bacterium CRU_2_1]